MSTNPVELAALPTAINIVEAVQTFFVNLGNDPAQVAAKLPGAAAVLLGSIEIQIPGLLGSELGAVQTTINQRLASAISSLKAKQAGG